MKKDIVRLSSKYQVVIPKAARKRMGLTSPENHYFKVVRVTDDEIVFKKSNSLDDYLGAYSQSFPAHASEVMRKQRGDELEKRS